jgi:hypothetical protein
LAPGLEWIERAGKNNHSNSAAIELLESIEQRQSGGKALIVLHERVAGQQDEIDFVIDGQGNAAVECGPRRIPNDRFEARRQPGNLTDRLIEARIGCVKKAQGRKGHFGGTSLFPQFRQEKFSPHPPLGEERLGIR